MMAQPKGETTALLRERSLAPQPEVVGAALAAIASDRLEAPLARLILHDPALVIDLLRLAASRSLIPEQPLTLDKLLEACGPVLAARIVTEAGERIALHAGSDEAQPRTTGFWLHSLACAHVARALAELVRYEAPDEAYLVGLVHDVGMAAIAARSPEFYEARLAAFPAEPDLLSEEAAAFAMEHPAFGAAMLDEWRLPPHLGDALLLHHLPAAELRGAHVLARILASAEIFASGPTTSTILEAAARMLQLEVHVLVQGVTKGIQQARAVAVEMGCSAPELDMRFPGGFPQFAPPAVWDARGERRVTEGASATRQVTGRFLDRARAQGKATEIGRAEDVQDAMLRLLDVLEVGYGVQSFAVFLPESSSESWAGWRVAAGALEALGFRVPYSVRTSLVVAAAQGRAPVCGREDLGQKGLSGVDLQIARRLRADDLRAVPAIDEGETCAVIVLGDDASRGESASPPDGVLATLAGGVAKVLRRARSQARETRAVERRARDRLKGEVRQLLHEARNPLTILGNYLELLAQRKGGTPPQEEMAIMRQELERVAEILDRIGRLDESGPGPIAEVDVNRLVSALLLGYRAPLFDARRIDVDLQLAPSLPLVQSAPDAIRQVLLNLLKNASEAMPGGGRLVVATAELEQDGVRGVGIQVADDGPGLPAEVQKRLEYQEGYERAPGRGYGLPTSIRLVNLMQGRLSWKTAPGAGTTFWIFLPMALKDARKAGEAA